ncbi:MAG: ABC transporter ATP-binding protein [Anaerolineales bacterium]|jgi:ABC-2 type transport system ATP-binding protein
MINTPIVEVHGVRKKFGAIVAVNDVTFNLGKGEIFGLLGPNGAGKTTILRLILDIFKPDKGAIAVMGGAMNERKLARIGYMPEERGLYQDVNLEKCLIYLATLKRVPKSEARIRVSNYLERFDLSAYRRKPVKQLSKGMQQKAQIIATLVHEPELVIVDEPFSGLDPVNTKMVKDLLEDLRDRGVAIIMSTHQMHQVEELCDRILLVDHGQALLYGEIGVIRNQYAGNSIFIRTRDALPDLDGVTDIEVHNAAQRLTFSEGTNPEDILRQLIAANIQVEWFEVAVPTLDEIFIQVVKDPEVK